MANHKSALKRARQNDKRRDRNNSVRNRTRSLWKKALEMAQAATSKEAALEALSEGARILQKAASKGVLPKLRVSRKISRWNQALNRRFSETTSSKNA